MNLRIVFAFALLGGQLTAQVACADCDEDGLAATILDSLYAAQISLGLIGSSSTRDCACEVNGDATLSVLDALFMAQAAAGLPVTLTCPSSSCSPPETWVQVFPVLVPPARRGHAMVYDPVRQVTVLFGGSLNDTWEWDGASWIERFPMDAPSPRRDHGMAYDAARGVTVLFGGEPNNDETWVWDGVNWVEQTPATSPPATRHVPLGYDPVAQRVVLFGGVDAGGYTDATWLWDGVNWSQAPSPTPPSARGSVSLAYDTAASELLLFGGSGAGVQNDTWQWDGAQWRPLSPVTPPTGVSASSLSHDPLRQIMLLFGGATTLSWQVVTDQTWEFHAGEWEEMSPMSAPMARHSHAVVFDEARGVHFLFAGYAPPSVLNDCWVY